MGLTILSMLNACTESRTGFDVSVVVDTALKVEQLIFSVQAADETTDPVITSGSETALLIVPQSWNGKQVQIHVKGIARGKVVVHGETTEEVRSGQLRTIVIFMGEGGCEASCEEGDVECVGDGLRRCETMANGCVRWSPAIPCPTDAPYCSAGACSATCTDECEEGQQRCATDKNYQVCGQHDSDGCSEWGSPLACATDEACVKGACIPQCGDGVCGDGETTATCPQDCPKDPCGDGVCSSTETTASCPKDCPKDPCGDGVCGWGETSASCPKDCPISDCVDKSTHCVNDATIRYCTDSTWQQFPCEISCGQELSAKPDYCGFSTDSNKDLCFCGEPLDGTLGAFCTSHQGCNTDLVCTLKDGDKGYCTPACGTVGEACSVTWPGFAFGNSGSCATFNGKLGCAIGCNVFLSFCPSYLQCADPSGNGINLCVVGVEAS